MGREERIPRRNRAGSKKIRPMAARRSFFGESSRLVPKSGKERFRVFRAPPRENAIPSTKAKERDKAPFFSQKRRFAKSGIQPNTFRRNRFPTKRRANSTAHKHTGGNFVIPRRGGESANLRRKTTQNATDFFIPAEAKKDFFDKRQSIAKNGWNVRISASTPSPLFLYPPFAGKSSFSRFLSPRRKRNEHARVLKSFSIHFNTLWKIFQPFSSEKARRN